jgi:hypothetical protein
MARWNTALVNALVSFFINLDSASATLYQHISGKREKTPEACGNAKHNRTDIRRAQITLHIFTYSQFLKMSECKARNFAIR